MAIAICPKCFTSANAKECPSCGADMSFDERFPSEPLGMSAERQAELEAFHAEIEEKARANHLAWWESPTTNAMSHISKAQANLEHAMMEMENAPDIEEYMNHIRAALAIIKPRIKTIIENRSKLP